MIDKIISFFKNKIALLILVVLIGLCSGYILGHDNVIEQLSELFIKFTFVLIDCIYIPFLIIFCLLPANS